MHVRTYVRTHTYTYVRTTMALSINQLALSQADVEHTFLQRAFPLRGAAFCVEARRKWKRQQRLQMWQRRQVQTVPCPRAKSNWLAAKCIRSDLIAVRA